MPVHTAEPQLTSESIYCIIEDQAFSPWYHFGSTLTPLPHSPFSKLDRRHIGKLRKRDNLLSLEGGGRRGGGSQIIRRREILVIYTSLKLSGLNIYE
jgi:hypothetical protein